MATRFGYAGKLLRADLTAGTLRDETLGEAVLDQEIGGTGLGLKYLYEEVPPDSTWSDAVNRLVIASGPLGGTKVSGSGTVSVVTKGAQTNMATGTQANGFLGAFLKLCGYDGIIVQGASPDWVYLHIDNDGAQVRDARHLLGLDTWEVQDTIEQANPGRKYSVFSIGPAGENLVHFAAIVGDRGHVAGHNGVGAVMGSKKLKAIAVARGKRQVPVFDRSDLSEMVERALAATKSYAGGLMYNYGTAGGYSLLHMGGQLPTRNYTTNVFPGHEKLNGQYTREHFKNKKAPCWACQFVCCRMSTVTEGPYTGCQGEEPEYEGFAAYSSLIGQTDAGAMFMLSNLTDRLGLEVNETGWVMGLAIECFERGLITEADTGGMELRWGNVEAVETLLKQIARREGFGATLAQGVRAAAERIGGEASNIGIYTVKGISPRTHDHRAKWNELLDTCVSNAGTIECGLEPFILAPLGVEPVADRFSWEQVSTYNAKVNGWRQFTDSLGVCNFNVIDPAFELEAFNAVTGKQLKIADAMAIGRRIVNQMRVYNVRCGLTPAMEEPSARYSSTPVDGPAAGRSVREHWDEMKRNYYRQMGWDEQTGQPKAETLKRLGLGHLVADLSSVAS